MKYFRHTVSLIVFCVLTGAAQTQQSVNLQGAWELVSQKENGKDHPISGRQIKLVTAAHYAWVRQDKKLLETQLARGTVRDSIAAYQDNFGAGSYTLDGNTYTETTEFFYAPQYIGTSLTFSFRIAGGLWYTSGHLVHYEKGNKVDDILLEQVFKRID